MIKEVMCRDILSNIGREKTTIKMETTSRGVILFFTTIVPLLIAKLKKYVNVAITFSVRLTSKRANDNLSHVILTNRLSSILRMCSLHSLFQQSTQSFSFFKSCKWFTNYFTNILISVVRSC